MGRPIHFFFFVGNTWWFAVGIGGSPHVFVKVRNEDVKEMAGDIPGWPLLQDFEDLGDIEPVPCVELSSKILVQWHFGGLQLVIVIFSQVIEKNWVVVSIFLSWFLICLSIQETYLS